MKVILALVLLVALCNAQEMRLVRTSEEGEPTWITYEEMLDLSNDFEKGFFDITPFPHYRTQSPEGPPLPNQPQQKTIVEDYIQYLDMGNMKSNVEILSSYRTRFYSTETGVEAAQWIHSTLRAYAGERLDQDITVEYFNSSATYPQPSVIARISGLVSDDIVILGSHEDSINLGAIGTAPGVDDDGSGTVSVLEVFRVLASMGYKPNRTAEFHFYAAEEVGLKGSQAIAQNYSAEGKVVVGMTQLDMDFYIGTDDEDVFGVVMDYVSSDLTSFLKQCIDTYSLISWVETVCNYGCSDHASWTAAGYRSCFPFESQFSKHNPYIHSSKDTLAYATLEHGLEFAKVGLGMVVELAATDYVSGPALD